jgi:hypothetical protein
VSAVAAVRLLGRAALVALLAAMAIASGTCVQPARALDQVPLRSNAGSAPRAAASLPRQVHNGAGLDRAPSSPPLVGYGEPASAGGGDQAGASPREADPLVSNGLGSPLCRATLGQGELSTTARRDCATSGFVAAPAPTGDYGIDVHIDTGLLGLSSGGLLAAVQDLFVTPLWMALVWAVHALVVMLEWCFAIDLLDSASVSNGVGRGLRQMQSAFTEPWLATVLAVASVLAAYDGLVRRRVAETVGQALLVFAMIGAGIWVMLEPTGTVGALGRWANQASLGTLAVTARGAPAGAGRALADSMQSVFAAAVEAPWCYLEFGDVGWCRDPARQDPRLRAAALKIAAAETALVGCRESTSFLGPCAASDSAQAKTLEHGSQLLREARSNAAIFLALPANGPARNSINEPGSLLRVMCQTSDATSCRGATAAQAEFRTNAGTWSRVGGLLLIVAGALGMMLLLGFIALRLLAAALFSLLYLLLAPAAVLAPALGESGRAAFRKWAAHLLGAVVSKLLFSFVLGVVLAVLAILADLQALGWWTQWLLMSAFWWGAYARRHQALGVTEGMIGREHQVHRRSLLQRAGETLESPRKLIRGARSTMGKLSRQPPGREQLRRLTRAGGERARAASGEQARRTLEQDYRQASAQAEAAAETQRRLAAKQAKLARLRAGRDQALSSGDARRAAELGHRAQRTEGEIEGEQRELSAARRIAREGEQARRWTGEVYSRAQREERDRFLDAQASLPAGVRAHPLQGAPRRDYAALAALAGYARAEYEQLDPRRQRAARLEVDRELALRRELTATATDGGLGGSDPLRARDQRKANRDFDHRLEQRMRGAGYAMPASRRQPSQIERWRQSAMADRLSASAKASSVLRDANEVARRRKRQLGRDRR